MKALTHQQIFNKVAKHLLKQNKKAMDKTFGACRMFNDEGLRCAVGCLIPLKVYKTNPDLRHAVQGTSSAFDAELYKHGVYIADRDVMELLRSLQTVHDTSEPKEWHKRLKSMAKLHKLDAKAVV